MKKFIIAIAAVLVCLSANAQKVGIEGGYTHNFTSYKTSVSDKWVSEGTSNGGFLGLDLEFPSESVVGFKTGLTLNLEGSSDAASGEVLGAKVSYTDFSVEIPVEVIFNCKFSETVGGFIYLGVSGHVGIVSNETITTITAQPTKTTIDLYKESYYNRCFLGANAGLGVDIAQHYRIFGEYGQSLTNLINTESIVNSLIDKVKVGYISVGFAYMF